MIEKPRKIRIAIDAQLLPEDSGGAVNALLALIRALAELSDGAESYQLIVGSEEQEAFWRSKLGPHQELALKSEYYGSLPRSRSHIRNGLKQAARAIARPWIRRLEAQLTHRRSWPEVPLSDGFYESLGCDVLHIPWQSFTLCAVPTVYNPHDLQHRYYPQFFTPDELALRESVYPVGCRLARTVVVGSQWAKDDFVSQFSLDPAKVQIIPEGPQIQLAAPIDAATAQEVKKRHRLPETYLVYPAITWPHKNHLRLLEALALLRDAGGPVVSLVLTGFQHPRMWPEIERRIRELHLESQLHCLGFVSESDLRAIQESAHGLVQPSLFEASSLPIYDAWLAGIPVACSRATALPEQVGNAALLFDPMNTREIAEAIATIMTKPDVRSELKARGSRRLKDFDWSRTAKAYRAVYRRAAGHTLGEEDRWLLQWDWMRNPEKTPQPVSANHHECS